MNRDDEVHYSRTVTGEGAITVEVRPDAYARILCWATHPIALQLGTIAPGEPCCDSCALTEARGSTSGSNLSESPGVVEHPNGSTEPEGT